MITNIYTKHFIQKETIKPITIENIDTNTDYIMRIINKYPKIFPHLYKQSFKIKDRILQGRVILKSGVVIVFRKYKRNSRISRNSNIVVKKGDFSVNQIVSSQMIRRSGFRVMNEFIKYCRNQKGENIYLTVRSDNFRAIKLYVECGFQLIDKTFWNSKKGR